MNAIIGLIAALALNQPAQATTSEPFRLDIANYQEYRQVKSPVTFVAIAKVKAGQAEQFKKIVNSLVNVMRTQEGNISYDLHQSLSDGSEFLFIEEWKSGKDMANHMDSDAVRELVSKAGALFETGFPKFLILKKN